MKKIDLHKFAIAAGFDIVCVDDESTSYEYRIQIRTNESMTYIMSIKNDVAWEEADQIIQSIMVVMPKRLRNRLNRLWKKREKDTVNNLIDLMCFTTCEYRAKTDYHLLQQYARLIGIELETWGYAFNYNLPKERYREIISKIECCLPVEDAVVLGKMKKLEYKINYLRRKTAEY